jgi:hypothetical protein
VTFKDLKKRISLEITQEQSKLFERLLDKSFWIWNIEEHKQEYIELTDIAALTMSSVCLRKMVLINLSMTMKK